MNGRDLYLLCFIVFALQGFAACLGIFDSSSKSLEPPPVTTRNPCYGRLLDGLQQLGVHKSVLMVAILVLSLTLDYLSFFQSTWIFSTDQLSTFAQRCIWTLLLLHLCSCFLTTHIFLTYQRVCDAYALTIHAVGGLTIMLLGIMLLSKSRLARRLWLEDRPIRDYDELFYSSPNAEAPDSSIEVYDGVAPQESQQVHLIDNRKDRPLDLSKSPDLALPSDESSDHEVFSQGDRPEITPNGDEETLASSSEAPLPLMPLKFPSYKDSLHVRQQVFRPKVLKSRHWSPKETSDCNPIDQAGLQAFSSLSDNNGLSTESPDKLGTWKAWWPFSWFSSTSASPSPSDDDDEQTRLRAFAFPKESDESPSGSEWTWSWPSIPFFS